MNEEDTDLDLVSVTVEIDAKELTVNYLMDRLGELIDYLNERKVEGATEAELRRINLTVLNYRGTLLSLDGTLRSNIESLVVGGPILAIENSTPEGV